MFLNSVRDKKEMPIHAKKTKKLQVSNSSLLRVCAQYVVADPEGTSWNKNSFAHSTQPSWQVKLNPHVPVTLKPGLHTNQ